MKRPNPRRKWHRAHKHTPEVKTFPDGWHQKVCIDCHLVLTGRYQDPPPPPPADTNPSVGVKVA